MAAAVCQGVVDAQGEMQEVEVAPVLAYVYVVPPRIRQLAARVLRAIPKAHIYAVVVFGSLLFLPCFERLEQVSLHKGVTALSSPVVLSSSKPEKRRFSDTYSNEVPFFKAAS